MTKLKLGVLEDDKPVKITLELSGSLHRELITYAEVLTKETGTEITPVKLISPMIERFIASDRGFAKARRARRSGGQSD